MERHVKPPLGLKPYNIWVEDRIKKIIGAMSRYAHADMPVPREFAVELLNHIDTLDKK